MTIGGWGPCKVGVDSNVANVLSHSAFLQTEVHCCSDSLSKFKNDRIFFKAHNYNI